MRVYLVDNENNETEINNVLQGTTISWVADDTMDRATIIFVSSEKTPINPLTLVRLKFEYGNGTFISGSTNDLLVASDSVEPYSKGNGTYKHTLSLVELTKILEKFFINNLVLTAEQGTQYKIYDQLDKAVWNINVHIGSDNYITLASNVYGKTHEYLTEDFVMSNATVREIFDEIFSACDCRVEVKSITYTPAGTRTIEVGFIDNNNLTQKTIVSANKIGTYANNNCDNFNGKIVSMTSNATPQTMLRQADNFKAKKGTTTSSNKLIMFAYEPEYVTNMKLVGKSNFSVVATYHYYNPSYITQTTSVAIGSTPIDLVKSYDGTTYEDIFVDYEFWQTLQNNEHPSETDYVKENTLYYERGQTEADVSRTYKYILFTHSSFTNAVRKAVFRYIKAHEEEILGTGRTLDSVALSVSIDDFYYDMTYAPLIDTMVEVSKDYDDYDKDLCVIDGQSANTLDLTRYGRNLLGKTQRIGNNDYTIDLTCDSYGDILEPFDYILDNSIKLVVYKTDIQVMAKHSGEDDDDKNWYKVRYYLCKNYNNISEKIALAREKRIYEIPLTGYKTIIPLREQVAYGVHSHYGIPGITAGEEDSAYKINAFIGQTLTEKTVYGTQTQLTPIENMLVTTCESYTGGQEIDRFCLPVCGFGCGNTMNFIAKFYDNYSAGLSATETHSIFDWVGGKKVAYNPYVDSHGELKYLKNINLANSNNIDVGISARPKRGTGETFKTFSANNIRYYKDRAESLQLQKIYKFKPTGGAWISPLCLEDNNAFFNSGRTLYVYRNCTFRQGQTIRTDGTSLGRAGSVLTCVVGHGTGSESDKYFAYVYVTNGNYYNNLIICDENNRIYAYIPRLSDNYKFIIK